MDPLREYAAATTEVATERRVPLIDLYQSLRTLLEPLTQEQADQFDASSHPNAKAEGTTNVTPDRTHLNDVGKKTFGTMVARAAAEVVATLRPYITLEPSTP